MIGPTSCLKLMLFAINGSTGLIPYLGMPFIKYGTAFWIASLTHSSKLGSFFLHRLNCFAMGEVKKKLRKNLSTYGMVIFLQRFGLKTRKIKDTER